MRRVAALAAGAKAMTRFLAGVADMGTKKCKLFHGFSLFHGIYAALTP